MDPILKHHQSERSKKSNDFEYYKNAIEYYDKRAFVVDTDFGQEPARKKKVNYDLMNNKLDHRDFLYVTKPWGKDVGELPAQMANRDILSSKIKAVLGIEARRPFNWKVLAVNEEATTRKETEEFNRLKEYVVNEVLKEIELETLQSVFQEMNPNATRQEVDMMRKQVSEQLQADPPEVVRKYMRREHQDPAEILGAHILAYLTQKLQLKDKFNAGCKHAAISAEEIYWVGEVNGEPTLRVVNPLYIDYDKSPDVQCIEDGEWAAVEYRMTPSQVIREFSDELTKSEQQDLYDSYGGKGSFEDLYIDEATDVALVRVLHVVWKGVTKVGFVKYIDEEGEEQEKVVLASYKLHPEIGDISIRYEWISQVHEGWKIGANLYKRMRPVPNQYKDLDNLKECKLPYIGAVYDYENSEPTSLVDRMRPYQYFYNILMYRMELLMAQNKGKKVFININGVPTSSGIKLKEFEYYMDSAQYTYLDPNEEGMRNNPDSDITRLVKEVDLSNTSDIAQYVQLGQYIEQRCGTSVGITPQLEGQIQEREAVGNVNRALTLSTNILETFFQTHDMVKRNVLQALIECAKVAYAKNRPRKINYFLDDMSVASLTIDRELLDSSTYGVFVTDSFKTQENQETITQLAHAAMQNQLVDMSTVVKILQASTVQEAEEILQEGEDRMQRKQMEAQEAQRQHEQEIAQFQAQQQELEHQRKLEFLREEERLKKEREIAKQAILAMGFLQEGDVDNDQTPDVLEVAKTIIEGRKLDLGEFKANADVALKQGDQKLKEEEIKVKKTQAKKSNQKTP